MKHLLFAAAALAAAFLFTGADAVQAAQGCGPGFARGPLGACRPMFAPRPGFGPGPRCFVRPTPYGPRRICRY